MQPALLRATGIVAPKETTKFGDLKTRERGVGKGRGSKE
jgi:hypothetical protein